MVEYLHALSSTYGSTFFFLKTRTPRAIPTMDPMAWPLRRLWGVCNMIFFTIKNMFKNIYCFFLHYIWSSYYHLNLICNSYMFAKQSGSWCLQNLKYLFESSANSFDQAETNKQSTHSSELPKIIQNWSTNILFWTMLYKPYSPFIFLLGGRLRLEACPNNPVTTLDLTKPNLRFIMAESISSSPLAVTTLESLAWKTWPGILLAQKISKGFFCS